MTQCRKPHAAVSPSYQWFREPIRRIGLSRLCNPMTCATSPGVRATMNAAAFRDGAGAVEPLSLRARRRRWPRPWRPNNSRDCEFEFTDARVPVEIAGCRVVLVHVEEREAIVGGGGEPRFIPPAGQVIGPGP